MSLLREYIRLLSEKQVRDQKRKRVLYHIGNRPAEPKPMTRPDQQGWRRYWLDQDVKSGVFFSPNPIDIASYHGVSGDVYAYKIPEWVIAKAGGIHRYDHGSEVLISADVWREAEDEIEFLGKSMTEDALWDKVKSFGAEPLRRSSGARPGWMSEDEWEKASTFKTMQSHISGLRSTKHPKNAVRMMKSAERVEALSAFESIDTPRKKDREIIELLKSYMNEATIRKYIRELFVESIEFRELDSPLRYRRGSTIKRIAYCDISVTEPPDKSDTYFAEIQEWERRGRTGRLLKKPRKGQLIPGVSNVCIIGFLDYHQYGHGEAAGNMWYIDYLKTREDHRGQGVASKLIDRFYETVANPGDHVHFGKMMRKEVGHLKDKMAKKYPDIRTIGAKNY